MESVTKIFYTAVVSEPKKFHKNTLLKDQLHWGIVVLQASTVLKI